jgi:hypothetical protein
MNYTWSSVDTIKICLLQYEFVMCLYVACVSSTRVHTRVDLFFCLVISLKIGV